MQPRYFFNASNRLIIWQEIICVQFGNSNYATQRSVEIRAMTFELQAQISIIKLVLWLLLFKLTLSEHLLLWISCEVKVWLFQGWLLLLSQVFLSFCFDKYELFVDAQVLHDVFGLKILDQGLSLLKSVVFDLVFYQVHGEKFIVQLVIVKIDLSILTLEKIYFSTEGLQKGIRDLAVSLPRLYSELNANTVSFTRPIIPSIYKKYILQYSYWLW